MLNIINHFTAHVEATEETPARNIKVFITDIVLDYKDRAILKHLVNSNVDIMALPDLEAARNLAAELDAQNKLVTSQKDVNIRYEKWHLAKTSDAQTEASDSESEHKTCEEPSIGPDHIYNQALVKEITKNVLSWCRKQKFQSFLSHGMLHHCVAKAIYGWESKDYDEHQTALINFAKEKFAERYCVESPFIKGGYNIGSELMLQMHPNGVKYRAEQYKNKNKKRTYFVILPEKMINQQTGEITPIPDGTFLERSKERLYIDRNLYYSAKA